MNAIFPKWQPEYAARGIATFPVSDTKKPRIRGWQKVGRRASGELATKFHDANALAYVTGRRSKVTVLDIDTTDAKIAEDAIQRHGLPVIVTRTASGKRHHLYRYNGERRRIRPFRELPIDLLGDNGYALAAPSKLEKGTYEIIHGHFDDLDRLTPMLGNEIDEALPTSPAMASIPVGHRNNSLWRHCMRQARGYPSLNDLIIIARAFNETCSPPLAENEVMEAVSSAWRYESEGTNRFGQHGAYFALEEVAAMVHEQDAFFLLAFLRANQGPCATFMCANGLASVLKWDRRRLAAARKRLIKLGYIKNVRQAGRGTPALFRWAE